MARIKLTPSGVLFNEQLHEYWLDGKQLSGITEAIKKMLHPELYQDIPESILKKAAEYGTFVHQQIYDFDHNFVNSGSQEVKDYIQICKQYNLVHEASEFTVTDGQHWASNIDKIYRASDDTFSIGDIKTYGVLTPEKQELARYQLSTYAWMLQLQNPKLKIDKLFIIHLRNKTMKSGKAEHICEIIFINRVPSFICEELLNCYLSGEKFNNPYAVPFELSSQEKHIRELLETKERVEEELNTIKADILNKMQSLDVKSWLTESGMRLTRKLPTTRSSFNLPLFKKEHPEFNYDDYMKISQVSGSLQIAI